MSTEETATAPAQAPATAQAAPTQAAPKMTSAQQRARYSGMEGRLKLLFGNCAELWTNYEKKHRELVEVFDFLKVLAGNLGDISQSIKKGEKCDNIVDEILDDLDAIIREREIKDKAEQGTLATLRTKQGEIMAEVDQIKSDVDKTLEARATARRVAASRGPLTMAEIATAKRVAASRKPSAPTPSAVATEDDDDDDEPVGLAAMGMGGRRYLRRNVSRKRHTPSTVTTEEEDDDEPIGLAAMGLGGKRYLRRNVSRKRTNKNSRKTRKRRRNRNKNKSRRRR